MATDVYYEESLFNFAKTLAKITKVGSEGMVLDVICEHLLGIPETEYAELAKEITSGKDEHRYKTMMQIIGMECRRLKDELFHSLREESRPFADSLYQKCQVFAFALHEKCGSESESLKVLPKVDLNASKDTATGDPYFNAYELQVLERAFGADMREMMFRYGYAGDRTLQERINAAYMQMRIPENLHEQIAYHPTGKEKESRETSGEVVVW